MTSDNPIRKLSEDEAWKALGGTTVGRLATVIDRQPDIFPVNYTLDGHSIVFKTAAGTKLLQLTANSTVAFEADGWGNGEGWSVVAKGRAHAVEETDELDRLEGLPLRSWVPTVKTHHIRINVDEINGRRFTFGDEPESEFDTAS